jgi:hypothetical protein|tara:strand:+ start:316 stop:567 length:252 start_codon:yes stop_codon:yes gene_type:complete
MGMFSVNMEGVLYIQKWIDENQESNPKVFDLWANGIASEINRSANLDQDLKLNGYFDYEVGLRNAQGYLMTITLDKNHFDSVS